MNSTINHTNNIIRKDFILFDVIFCPSIYEAQIPVNNSKNNNAKNAINTTGCKPNTLSKKLIVIVSGIDNGNNFGLISEVKK